MSRFALFLEVANDILPVAELFDVANGAALVGRCTRVELLLDDASHPRVLARFHANPFHVGVRAVFANGPARTDLPIVARAVTDVTNVLVADVVTNGLWEPTIDPGDGSESIILEATFDDPDPTLQALGDQHLLTAPVRDRIELQGRRSGDLIFADQVPQIGASGAVQLRVRLAGEGVAGVALSYSLSGPGELSTTGGVTNADGEAPPFTYTAPAEPMDEAPELTVLWQDVGADVLTLDLAAVTTTSTTSTTSTTIGASFAFAREFDTFISSDTFTSDPVLPATSDVDGDSEHIDFPVSHEYVEAAASASVDGHMTADGTASLAAELAFVDTSSGLTITGIATVTSNAGRTQELAGSSRATNRARYVVAFDVFGGPMAFSIDGTLALQPGSARRGTAKVTLRQNGLLVKTYDEAAIADAGVLSPASYSVVMETEAFATCCGTATAGFDVTLSVTPPP
jgi:hypothetical protein